MSHFSCLSPHSLFPLMPPLDWPPIRNHGWPPNVKSVRPPFDPPCHSIDREGGGYLLLPKSVVRRVWVGGGGSSKGGLSLNACTKQWKVVLWVRIPPGCPSFLCSMIEFWINKKIVSKVHLLYLRSTSFP